MRKCKVLGEFWSLKNCGRLLFERRNIPKIRWKMMKKISRTPTIIISQMRQCTIWQILPGIFEACFGRFTPNTFLQIEIFCAKKEKENCGHMVQAVVNDSPSLIVRTIANKAGFSTWTWRWKIISRFKAFWFSAKPVSNMSHSQLNPTSVIFVNELSRRL